MTNENEWHRPKKPYTVNVDKSQPAYNGRSGSSDYKKSKPKSVVVPQRNNQNSRALLNAMKSAAVVRVTINNLLSSDEELLSVYEGVVKGVDDFTVLIESPTGSYLINKSSIAVIDFGKNDGN